jgi:inner membrane protease subunit 2
VNNGSIRHGDVVTFTAPHDPDMTLVKRIIALEGDIVHTRVSPVMRYDIPEKNLRFSPPPRVIKVPKGHCWVESDESYRGIDSNVFGPIPLSLLQARTKYIVWPPERIGKIADGKLRTGVEYSF